MNKVVQFAFLLFIGGFSWHSMAQTGSVAEEGVAKYYAKNLSGRVTSYGETYDDAQLTASHSKYPLNTILRVTNLENMKSVEVRVNDYCRCEEEGKIINLSREAASRLGMIASGKAYVRVEFLSRAGVSPVQVTSASFNGNSHVGASQPTSLTTLQSSSALPATSNAGSFRDTQPVYASNNVKSAAPITSAPAASSVPSVYSDRSNSFLPERTYDINGTERFPKGFGVQVTALMNLNKIQDVYDDLVRLGTSREQIFIQVSVKDVGKVYRLLMGEFNTREAAEVKKAWLEQQGYRGMVKAHYNL